MFQKNEETARNSRRCWEMAESSASHFESLMEFKLGTCLVLGQPCPNPNGYFELALPELADLSNPVEPFERDAFVLSGILVKVG
jgi:hypothetical protein